MMSNVRSTKLNRHTLYLNADTMLKSIKYDLIIALPALTIASLVGAYSVVQ